jgi:hypothetical protein
MLLPCPLGHLYTRVELRAKDTMGYNEGSYWEHDGGEHIGNCGKVGGGYDMLKTHWELDGNTVSIS